MQKLLLFVDKVSIFNGVRMPVRVLLQGPWNEGAQLMNDGMRSQGLVGLALEGLLCLLGPSLQ